VFCSFFFFSSRRRHTRSYGDWSSDVCSSDLALLQACASQPVAPELPGEQAAAAETASPAPPAPPRSPPVSPQAALPPAILPDARSEERRVGKECRTRGGASELKRNKVEERRA